MNTSIKKCITHLAIAGSMFMLFQPLFVSIGFAENTTGAVNQPVQNAGSPTPFHVFTIPPSNAAPSNTPTPTVLLTPEVASSPTPSATRTPLSEADRPFLETKFEWPENPLATQFEQQSQSILEAMNRDTEINHEKSIYFQYVQALIEFKTNFQQYMIGDAIDGRIGKADVFFLNSKKEWKISKAPFKEPFSVTGEYLGQIQNGKPHGYGVVQLDGYSLTYFGYFEAGIAVNQGLIFLGDEKQQKTIYGFTNVGQVAIWDQQKLEMIQFDAFWESIFQLAGENANRPVLEMEERVKEQGLLMLSALAYAEIPKAMLNQDVSTILNKLPLKEKQKLTTVAYRDSSFTKWLENIRLIRIIDERDYFQSRIKTKLGQTGLYALVFERIDPNAKQEASVNDLVISFRGTRIGMKGFNHSITEQDWREINKILNQNLFLDIKSKLLGNSSTREWPKRKIQLTGYSGGGLLAQGVASVMLEQGVHSDQIHLVTFNGIGLKRNWLSSNTVQNGFGAYQGLGTNWLVEGEWSAQKLDYDDRVGLTRVIPNAIYQSVEESLRNTLGPSFYHSIDRFFEFYNAGLVDRSVVDLPIDWMKTASSSLTVKGTKASEYLTGTPWSDRIFGMDGADQLNGGEGGNYLDAGNGSDQVIVNASLKEISEPSTKSNRCYSLKLVAGNGMCEHVLLGNDKDTDVLMILNGNVFLDQTKPNDRVIIEQTKFGSGIQVKYDKKADRLKVEYRANDRAGKIWISRWRTLVKGAENEGFLRFLDDQKFADVTLGELNQATKSTKTLTLKLKFVE